MAKVTKRKTESHKKTYSYGAILKENFPVGTCFENTRQDNKSIVVITRDNRQAKCILLIQDYQGNPKLCPISENDTIPRWYVTDDIFDIQISTDELT